MSWLSGLADKAENLLNKIDQNAAAVLQEKDKIGYINNVMSAIEEVQIKNDNLEETHIVDMRPLNSNYNHGSENSTPTKLKGKSLKKLNKKVKSAPKKADLNAPSDESTLQTSNVLLQNEKYLSTMESPSKNSANSEENSTSEPNEDALYNKYNELNTKNDITDELFNKDLSDETINSSNEAHSYINMENEMLRNEISVVNNEVSLLLSKAKNAEKLTVNTQTRLQQIEKLYTETVIERDNLLGKVQKLEELQANLRESSEKLELDDRIQTLEEDRKHLQQEIRNLELSLMNNVSLKTEFESDLNIFKSKCAELEDKLDKAKIETSNAVLELKNYKVRANNTLMLKDKIIGELGGNGEATDSESNPLNTQINQLKIEREELLEEVFKYQNESEIKTKDLEVSEHRMRSTERQVSALREALRQEKAAKEMADHTITSLSKELTSLQTETAKQISLLRTKLKDKASIEKEKLQSNSSRSSLNVSESGEDRLRSLTQALVAKQAALESITSDRNALRLQLEKTENKYRSDLVSMRNNQPRIINLNDTDDDNTISVKARFPPMMQESPWDSSLSRQVKKAYSTLDSFSVRVGVFLRRNPIARIFIISYMIILHMWVFIVLFTYKPEIRS